MPTFDVLYKEFANTQNGNLCEFCKNHKKKSIASRFLLIRTFDEKNLRNILTQYSIPCNYKNEKKLMQVAYESNLTIKNLLDYIETNRTKLIQERLGELDGLQNLLRELPITACGIRDDNIDALVKSFTRNKELKDINSVKNFLSMQVIPDFIKYCLWSFYNQTANDIIEIFLLQHKKVIPTPRKITNIDFFLQIDDELVPFDLKLTHVSDEYFEIAAQGLDKATKKPDSYINSQKSQKEFQQIKDFYKTYKKDHKEKNLPNIKDLPKNKSEFSEFVASLDDSTKKYIGAMKKKHNSYISNNSETLKKIEWWNYKNQGSRLFCNNNRLFIFVAYQDKFIDGKDLKIKTNEIGNQLTQLLDNLSPKSFHKIKYQYTNKEAPKLHGDYSALSFSTIYSE